MMVFNKLKVLLQNKVSKLEPKAGRCPLLNNTVNILKQHSIACKCGGLAVPISKKGNVFRCIHCTEEHRYINYNLGRLNNYLDAQNPNATISEAMIFDMNSYDDAIKILQEEYKRPYLPLKRYFKT